MKKINVKLIWSILCQEASVDSSTNSISLFKFLEEIKFGLKMEDVDKLKDNPKFDPTKPIVLPFALQLVALWKNLSDKSDFEFPVKILFKDPNEKVISETSNSFFFQEGKERL